MANNYPLVINGNPVDADAWFNQIATDLTNLSTSLTNRVTALEAKGYVISAIDTTSNASTTTTEVVSSSISFTALAAPYRYEVEYQGVAESSVAADICTVQLRWKNSASADTTGTSFSTDNKTPAAAAHGDAFSLKGDFNTQAAGVLTVVATIFRQAGSGTVKQNLASAGQRGYFIVKII